VKKQNKQALMLSAISTALLMAYGGNALASVTSPVIGKLLWSEEFNGTGVDTSRWTATDGNGCQINLCGYGNQELEYYSPNNLSVVNVPFESATRALAIQARRQTIGSNVFTSGKISSAGKVAVKYGMVEVRVAGRLDAGREPAELAAQWRDRHHGNGAPGRWPQWGRDQ
jgi:beta-glucanase (GH16 family)